MFIEQTEEKTNNNLWVEKYRPTKLVKIIWNIQIK